MVIRHIFFNFKEELTTLWIVMLQLFLRSYEGFTYFSQITLKLFKTLQFVGINFQMFDNVLPMKAKKTKPQFIENIEIDAH